MLIQVVLLIVAIVVLYYGAELALESAEKIGKFFGLSPLVIGLLIVGFGTSLPEFFVSQLAAYRQMPEMAFGNILGSNVANHFLVMGVASLLVPLTLNTREIRDQLIILTVMNGILFYVLHDRLFTITDSFLLGGFFLSYLYMTFLEMKKDKKSEVEEELKDHSEDLGVKAFVKLFCGFLMLYGGGELLVTSGSKLAIYAGISAYVVSAILVAFGTSFPELVTAVLACKKKKDVNLITGNVIGSNIFNATFVLGSLGAYRIETSSNYLVELSALMATSIFLLGFFFLKKNFHRFGAVVFLASYGGMVYYWVSA